MYDAAFVPGIREILGETGLDPRYLQLELTETVLVEDSRSAMQLLKDLKDTGPVLTLETSALIPAVPKVKGTISADGCQR